MGNAAEKGAFNPAIAAATGDEKQALTNGKIKNKILKLMATTIQLQIQAAQYVDDHSTLAMFGNKCPTTHRFQMRAQISKDEPPKSLPRQEITDSLFL